MSTDTEPVYKILNECVVNDLIGINLYICANKYDMYDDLQALHMNAVCVALKYFKACAYLSTSIFV